MDKCPRCKKAVYFAERRLYNGAYYHQLCCNKQLDEDQEGKKLFAIHEDMNCNPNERDRIPVNTAQSLGIPKPSTGLACSCGNSLRLDQKFCPQCGQKVVIPEPEPEPVVVETPKPDPREFCAACEKKFSDDARFCVGCGSKRPE